jgi:predicted RND superfamily exporter protein
MVSKGRAMRFMFFLPDHHNGNVTLYVLLALLFFTALSCSQMAGREASENKKSGDMKMDQHVSGDYRSNEVIVKFKDDLSDKAIERIAESENIEIMKVLSRRVYLFRITGTSSVEDTIEALKKRKEVEYAEPDYIQRVK